jgi:hypothetical protein
MKSLNLLKNLKSLIFLKVRKLHFSLISDYFTLVIKQLTRVKLLTKSRSQVAHGHLVSSPTGLSEIVISEHTISDLVTPYHAGRLKAKLD